MTGRLRITRLLAALVFGAAGGTILSVGAAYAAACPAGTGVTVVVNSSVGCDRNGGGSASSNFRDAGHTLTRAQRQPGFVCRVDGYPASDPCVNTSPGNAYWGLFWSNGKSGAWTFSSSGVDGLNVPTGGWVAFKFQTGSKSYPGVRPYTAPPPKPKPKPTAQKTTASTKHTATPTPSASSKSGDSGKAKGDKQSSPATTPTNGATTTTQPGDDLKNMSQETGGSGSLGWVAGGLAIVLIAGMGGVLLWRRSTAGGRTS